MADDKITGSAGDKGMDHKTKSTIVALIGLSVAVMVLTPIITIYAFRVMTKQPIEVSEVVSEISEITLPKVQVNVADTNGTRYAQIEIVISVSDPTMQVFFEERTNDRRGRLKRIMSIIIGLVGDKNMNSLLSTSGKRQLANEIKSAINELLAKETTGMITDVYFSGFLVQ